VKRALDDVGGVKDRVIAEKVEAGFLGRDVRDVGGVGRLPRRASRCSVTAATVSPRKA